MNIDYVKAKTKSEKVFHVCKILLQPYRKDSKVNNDNVLKSHSFEIREVATIITSNKSFDQWRTIFQDDVVASAILDRLLHHSYTFIIQGKSYRMKNIKK